MDNNKTAVDWFQDQIIAIVEGRCEYSEIVMYNTAKELFKKQIAEAWEDAKKSKSEIKSGIDYYFDKFEKK